MSDRNTLLTGGGVELTCGDVSLRRMLALLRFRSNIVFPPPILLPRPNLFFLGRVPPDAGDVFVKGAAINDDDDDAEKDEDDEEVVVDEEGADGEAIAGEDDDVDAGPDDEEVEDADGVVVEAAEAEEEVVEVEVVLMVVMVVMVLVVGVVAVADCTFLEFFWICCCSS